MTASPSPAGRHPRADTCAGRPVESVLAMLAAGKTQREIAAEFGVRWRAIRHHVERHGFVASKHRSARAGLLKDAAKAADANTRLGRIAFASPVPRAKYTASEIAEALGVSRGVIVGISGIARGNAHDRGTGSDADLHPPVRMPRITAVFRRLLDEIKDALGVKSKSHVHRIVTELVERGYLCRGEGFRPPVRWS